MGRVKNRGNLKEQREGNGFKIPFRSRWQNLRRDWRSARNKITTSGSMERDTGKSISYTELGKEDVAAKILAIIKREQDQAFWRRLHYTCGKVKGGSPTLVQVEGPSDLVTEHVTKTDVENAIWTNIHRKRFYLAEEAPICKGRMRGDLGYNAVSPTAQGILDGTYEYPEDFDTATRGLREECALIRQIIPEDSVGTKMMKEDFILHWKKEKEEMSSSHSDL